MTGFFRWEPELGLQDNRVPLVIGVTGHRDLVEDEIPAIRDRIGEFFASLQRDFPGLPLLVMTPLAEGADRLVAEVASELGLPIVILLPMKRSLYQDDFFGASLVEYNEMMKLGEIVELPLVGENTEADVQNGAARDLQYAQLGAYLAAHSHILLAIWDGKPSIAQGGTGHVVQFHQHDVIELIAEGQQRSPIDFAEDESDLVYHVVCSRVEDGPPASPLEPGTAQWFTRDDVQPRTDSMPGRYKVVFQRMHEFNEDLQRPMHLPDYYPLISASVAGEEQGAKDIADLFQRADYLAGRYQRWVMASLRASYSLAALAGLSFIVYADLPDLGITIYPYPVFIALALLVFALDRRYGWHRKYLDYRVLAEALRVQFYWSLAGVGMSNPSRFSHDSFLRRQDLELGWIRNVMRFAGRHADANGGDADPVVTDAVIREWIGDDAGGQLEYYRRKSRERSFRSRLTASVGTLCFVSGLAVAMGLALFHGLGDGVEPPLFDLMVALMGLLPLVAAIRQSYAHRTAERELINQYQYMSRIFANAYRLLQNAGSPEAQRDILRAVGESALDENGQWILRQRERPLSGGQVVHGG